MIVICRSDKNNLFWIVCHEEATRTGLSKLINLLTES